MVKAPTEVANNFHINKAIIVLAVALKYATIGNVYGVAEWQKEGGDGDATSCDM